MGLSHASGELANDSFATVRRSDFPPAPQQQFPRHELAVLQLAARSRSPTARVPEVLSAFLSPTAFHLVLSHAPGGDLWGLLERKNAEEGQEGVLLGLEESWVRRWMADLVEVLEWLHVEGWAHRCVALGRLPACSR